MRATDSQRFIERHLPFLIFLLPVITVNLAYLIASSLNHVPDCITYLSGCTSISSTGRVMPQKGIFLFGLIPTAVLSMMFWTLAGKYLGQSKSHTQTTQNWLMFFGATASIFLIVYVSTLGIPGTVYTLVRKFAVLIYFGFTYIAQLLVVKQLLRVAVQNNDGTLLRWANRLKWYCVFVMAIGILIVPFSLVEDAILRKKIENIIEWNYAFLIYVYFLLVYVLWRKRRPTQTSS